MKEPIYFHKVLERDLTFISQGEYVRGMEGYNYLGIGRNNPFLPAILIYEKEGCLQFWENERGANFFIDAVVKQNQQGLDFINTVIAKQREILIELKKYWAMPSTAELLSLDEYLELMRIGVANVAFYYYTGSDERISAEARALALAIRTEDDFFAYNDAFLRRFFKERGFEERISSVILASEINDIPSREVLEARAHSSVLIGGNECVIGSYEEFMASHPGLQFKHEQITSLDSSVKGQVAYAGNVRGRVRIVKTLKQVNELESEEILITPMTTPDFISAMQKAAAFVTDEGGIMCHASIIARELKKPCIIGTRLATELFKDGDIVEVDAVSGVVTKLN